MRVFEHPNLSNFNCPICNTSEDKPVTLCIIDGTKEDRIAQAIQIHIDCITLIYYKDNAEYLTMRIS